MSSLIVALSGSFGGECLAERHPAGRLSLGVLDERCVVGSAVVADVDLVERRSLVAKRTRDLAGPVGSADFVGRSRERVEAFGGGIADVAHGLDVERGAERSASSPFPLVLEQPTLPRTRATTISATQMRITLRRVSCDIATRRI